MIAIFLEKNILIFGILLSLVIASLFIVISYFLVKREFSIEKNSAYECGFQPFDDARIPFDIHFYLVAILFLIFDLEVLFLVPYILNINFMTFEDYTFLLVFLIILTLGFFYEWKLGALNW